MKLASFLLSAAAALSLASATEFLAVLSPTTGNSGLTASVLFEDAMSVPGVNATLSGCGFQAGSTHALHIHTYGDITDSMGSAAAGHFNPFNVSHACTGARHVGDLGNFEVDQSGCVSATFNSPTASLDPADPGYILGRGVIIHSGVDDCTTQPTGNAGGRLMQGVVGLKSEPVVGSSGASGPSRAIAVLQKTSSTTLSIKGTVILTSTVDGVSFSFYLSGLAPNTWHGIHVHQYGVISAADGTATGGHFNPYGVPHACTGEKHTGDMGSFLANENGLIVATYLNTNATLVPDAVNSILGRAIIVHEKVDDCTGAAGNAGARYAQGVIGVAAAATSLPGAISNLKATAGNKTATGSVVFTPVNNGGTPGLNAHIQLSGLDPNSTHGIHIHIYGDITKDDGSGASGHYNPTAVSHACNGTRHYGDLGNFVVDENGNVDTNIFSELIGLDPNKGNSFILGRGLIVHATYDDCTTQPTGNSGARLLQGVIGYQYGTSPINATASSDTFEMLICKMSGLGGSSISGRFILFPPQGSFGVQLQFSVSGLTPSTTYGIHIHEFGDDTSSTGSTAGGHFNPFGSPHGCPPNVPRHVGDMGNFTTDSSGDISASFYNEIAAISTLNTASIAGRSIIIHSSPDDCASQPTGNAGSRIAQCVIGYTAYDASVYPTSAPTGTPTPTPTPTSTPAPTEPNSSASSLLPSLALILLSLLALRFA